MCKRWEIKCKDTEQRGEGEGRIGDPRIVELGAPV